MTTINRTFSNHKKYSYIRLANPSDYEVLIALDTVVSHDQQRVIQIKNWINDQYCYLLELNGEIVAYAVVHYHFFDCGFIEMLMVAESARKNGLGLILIEHIKTICTSPKLFTSTNKSNQGMQYLLKIAGFIPSGYIDNLDEDDTELIYFWAKNNN
nr:GNAT family N-acetyltransferase [uncultured Moellerella sp.]